MLLLVLCATLLGAKSAPPEVVFLHVFPVSIDDSLPAGSIELELNRDVKTFGELTRRRIARRVDTRRLRVTLGDYPLSRDRPVRRYRACSFLIDCDEPIVRELGQRIREEIGANADLPALTSWVRHYITRPNHSRGFDLASVVARRRVGDCSEHSVLLAAMARLHGHATRVVLGLVLVGLSGHPTRAFGHAWVEHHDGKRWTKADAALPLAELERSAGAPLTVQYLPIQVIDREDAGYAAAILDGASLIAVSGVRVPRAGK